MPLALLGRIGYPYAGGVWGICEENTGKLELHFCFSHS